MQKSKRAVLFANGVLTQTSWIKAYIQPDDLLVAVDGGYHYMKTLNLTPDLVIGDLDSLTPEEITGIEDLGIEIVRYPPEKDETDLELAFETVSQRGYKHIRVIAAFGGRTDQTLANVFLLNLPALEGRDVRYENGNEEAFVIRSSETILGESGDSVSLLPLGTPAQGVSTQGLAYPLNGETLQAFHSRGISNEMLQSSAVVSIESGLLLVIHSRQNPQPAKITNNESDE